MAAFWKSKIARFYHAGLPVAYTRWPSKKSAALLGSFIGLLLVPLGGYALSNHISNSETVSSGGTSNTLGSLPTPEAPLNPAPAGSSSSSSTSLSASTQSNSSGSSNTSLTVNGQSIDVPQNGSVDKTITDNNGQTQVHVDVNNSGTSSSNSHSSSVHINSTSHTSGTSFNSNLQQESGSP